MEEQELMTGIDVITSDGVTLHRILQGDSKPKNNNNGDNNDEKKPEKNFWT